MRTKADPPPHLDGIPPFSPPKIKPISDERARYDLATAFKAIGYNGGNLLALWWLGPSVWQKCIPKAHQSPDANYAFEPLPDTPELMLLVRYVYASIHNASAFRNVANGQDLEVFPVVQGVPPPWPPHPAPPKPPQPHPPAPQPDPSRYLPYEVARLLASAFVKGLVTRLLLGRYATAWSKHLQKPFSVGLSSSGPAADKLINDYLLTITKNVSDANKWNSDYKTCLENNFVNAALQLMGILMGWRAGDQLEASHDDDADAVFWELFRARNTPIELGRMVGYTFEFISGTLYCDRTQDILRKKYSDPSGLTRDDLLKTVYPALEAHNRQRLHGRQNNGVASAIGEQFYAYIMHEFFAVTQAQKSGDTDPSQSYATFLVGFVEGMSRAAESLFTDMYVSGYTLGYSNGFNAGYAQGYAAGYQVGYSDGQNANSVWSDIQTIISGANSISSIVSTADTVTSMIGDIEDGVEGSAVVAFLFD